MRQNASYPKCSRSENALKCTQRENEECSCRECKQRGSRMHENATNSRMQHEWNALKCVQMYCNAHKCMRMRYVRNYTDLRKKLHHTLQIQGHSARRASSMVRQCHLLIKISEIKSEAYTHPGVYTRVGAYTRTVGVYTQGLRIRTPSRILRFLRIRTPDCVYAGIDEP